MLHLLINYLPTRSKYSSIDRKFVIKADLYFALKADVRILCGRPLAFYNTHPLNILTIYYNIQQLLLHMGPPMSRAVSGFQ